MTLSMFQRGRSIAQLSTLLIAGLSASGINAEEPETELEDYVVEDVEDQFSIIPSEPSGSAFGFDKTLLETPRSVSAVTSELVQNYGLRSVDDLVRLTPGAFTSSFFGIQGAMDIRGEPADNFFRGFRRIDNPGAFKTNIRGASNLEIMRGPVSPLYGTGSVGGQLNYTPKSAKSDTAKYISDVTGRVDLTVGTYNQKVLSGELGVPFELAGKKGGVYFFAEREDSESFYDGYEPSGTMFQMAVDFDLTSNTVMEFGFQWQEGDHIQVPGWNRVTQELIDDNIYITGAPPVRNSDNPIGADRLLPQESGFIADGYPFPAVINSSFSGVGSFCSPSDSESGNYTYNGFNIFCPGISDVSNPYPLQDGTVGRASIDHDTTFIDELDFADTTALTAYLDFSTTLGNGMVWKNQFFYDYMDHTKYQSWGFTALYPDANATEFRSSLTFDFNNDLFDSQHIVGVNFRRDDLDLNHAFYDETFDFRDITVGATPDDRIDWAVEDPFENATIVENEDGSLSLEGTVRRNFNEEQVSDQQTTGIFYLTDVKLGAANLLLGARYDYYDIEATEEAQTLLGYYYGGSPDSPTTLSDTDTAFSYNASFSYRFDPGFVPYITYGESNSLSTNQLGGVTIGALADGSWLQESEILELGLKMDLMDGRLYSAISYFDQEKTFRDGQTGALVAVFSDGLEFELRALLTDIFSVTATATHIETTEISDGALAIINGAEFAAQNGLEPEQVYGGRIGGNRATFVGEGVELDRGGLPDNTASLYLNYADTIGAGKLTGSLGVTYASSTYTDVLESVKLPSYQVWTASMGYVLESFEVLLTVNNLTDEKYYTSADLFDSVVVKPSELRTASLMFTYKF